MSTATAEKPRRKSEKSVEQATFPVRLFNVVDVAFKQDTAYAVSHVQVTATPADGDQLASVRVAGTDGRCLVEVEYQSDMFDENIELSILVPGNAARMALKNAAASEDDEPMATLIADRDDRVRGVKVKSTSNVVSDATWLADGDQLPFPDYAELFPDPQLFGASRIGINPLRTKRVLATIAKIVGPDCETRMHLPDIATRPLFLQADDGKGTRVRALVMPSDVKEWTDTGEDDQDADGDQGDQHELFNAWRDASINELDLSDAIKAKLNVALNDGKPATIGQLHAVVEKPDGRYSSMEGVTQLMALKIGDAVDAYFEKHKITPPPLPSTPAQLQLDQAQQNVLTYINERFKHVGVPEQVRHTEQGTQMDEAVMAMVMSESDAKNVRLAFEGDAATSEKVTDWHNKLKALSDAAYKKAAKSAGFKVS